MRALEDATADGLVRQLHGPTDAQLRPPASCQGVSPHSDHLCHHRPPPPEKRLDRVLPYSFLGCLSTSRRTAQRPWGRQFNLAWHNLRPWPDAVPGLYRLKHRFIIAPMSNGNVALMTNMAKNGGLPWDCILGAELARHYKPDLESYLTAVHLLSLRPEQVMMVAAHQGDLVAAGKVGLQTGFVPRPLEHGPGRTPDPTPDPSFTGVATDFMDLAVQLNV